MAKTTYNNVRLGLFVILALAAFTFAMYKISNQADLFQGSILIKANFRDVRGLQPGNNVRFAGINIGSVDDISLQGDTLVLVTMKVTDQVTGYMRKDAIADIGTNGLVGNMLVNITSGPGRKAYVQDGDMIASFTGWTGQMMGNLTTTSADLKDLTSSLNQIADKINRGSGTLALLLNDENMALELQQTIKELRTTSSALGNTISKTNVLMSEIDKGEGILGRLIKDEESTQYFDKIITGLDTLVNDEVPALMGELKSSGEELSESAVKLRKIIENLDQEGLMGSILGDPEKARQLDQIMKNLEEGTAKFNTSMDGIQNHWLLRRSLEKSRQEGED